MNDSNRETRLVALRCLDRLRTPPREILPELRETMLHDRDAGVRLGIAMVLERIGWEAIPALLEGLSDVDDEVRGYAYGALARMTPDKRALPVLLKSLKHEQFRKIAMVVMSNMGREAEDAIPDLERFLDSKDLATRCRAARSLWKIDQRPEKILPILIEGLERGDEDERLIDARYFTEMGTRATPAIPALVKALHDDSYRVRGQAAESLAKVGPEARAAISGLRGALDDVDLEVRQKAAEALSEIEKSLSRSQDGNRR